MYAAGHTRQDTRSLRHRRVERRQRRAAEPNTLVASAFTRRRVPYAARAMSKNTNNSRDDARTSLIKLLDLSR